MEKQPPSFRDLCIGQLLAEILYLKMGDFEDTGPKTQNFKKKCFIFQEVHFCCPQKRYILIFRPVISRCLNLSKENPSKPHFLVI